MEVVWAFEQGTALPPGHKGVCMQLVAYWLSIMQYAKAENDTARGEAGGFVQGRSAQATEGVWESEQGPARRRGRGRHVATSQAAAEGRRLPSMRDGG